MDLSALAPPTAPPAHTEAPGSPHTSRLNSLDLTRHVPIPVARKAVTDPRQRSEKADRFHTSRARYGPPTILTAQRPVVTLTRVQSGVGALTIQAACSDLVGDLRVGCAYQIASGLSSLIHTAGGLRAAPAGSERPVISATSGRFEGLSIDLSQCQDIERLIVYVHSASGATLSWDGSLVVQTYGGAHIEVPMRRDPAAGVMVPLSLFNVEGEFVLRAEQFFTGGSIRDATASFGFERISWLDDHTPLA